MAINITFEVKISRKIYFFRGSKDPTLKQERINVGQCFIEGIKYPYLLMRGCRAVRCKFEPCLHLTVNLFRSL